MKKIRTLLVVSSTYPVSSTDKVPGFVHDQMHAFLETDEDLKIVVLSPHNQASQSSKDKSSGGSRIITERFHYFIPRFEQLTDRGIMPAITSNVLNYALIPFLIVGEFIALIRYARKYKPDVIYAHWFTPQAVVASLVSRLTQVPFGFTTHASDVDVWRRFGIFGRAVVHFGCKNAVFITSVSTRTAQKLVNMFPLSSQDSINSRITIIPMGINPPASYVDSRKRNGVLFIGRLTEKKGLQFALPAIKNLHKEFPDIHLTIAGDGEMRRQLQKMVNELALTDRVTFTGFVSGKEKTELLENHSIMIVPSIVTDFGDAEGLPVSLLEGLSYGMICIATDASGADDVIENSHSGIIIKQRDTDAIYDSLKQVLQMSEAESITMKKEAHKIGVQHDWSVIAARHLELFNKSINDS